MKLKLAKSFRLLVSLWCLFAAAICAYADVNVTGTVLDATGETLPGATVRLKGNAAVAVATNVDGRFMIKVPNLNATLEVSFIGYKTETVALKGRSDVEIVLNEDSQMLDEVVAVGYGVAKKATLTGSVSAITGADLVKAPMQNVSNLLTGKVSGLTAVQSSGKPGEDAAAIHVRGVNDFNGSGPLVIIDGVPGDMNMVNPNDIENVSVLKDASAAIYGVRAANGVILITTKQGKDGTAKISYSGNVAIVRNTALPKFLNAEEYMYWHNKASIMDGLTPRYDADIQARVLAADPDDYLGSTDWIKETFRTGITQQHTVSATGGSKNVSYFVSLGLMDQQGTMRGTDYRRYNFRSNLDVKVAKNMRFLANISGYRTEKEYPNADMGNQSSYNPAVQAVYMLPILQKEYKGYPVSYGAAAINPLATLDQSGWSNNYANNLLANFQLEYDFKDIHPILDGLKASLWGSYNFTNTRGEAFFGTIYSYNVNVKNFAEEPKLQTKADYPNGDEVNGRFSKSVGGNDNWIIRPQVSYDHKFGKARVSALYLYEATKNFWSGLGASARKYIARDPIDVSLGLEIDEKSVSGSYSQNSVVSHVGRFNFDWDEKYLVEFAFRCDGSYKFAPKNRWGFFPSVSAGWVMSQEKFIKDIEWIDFLKIRASYGEAGKDNLTAYLYTQLYNTKKDGYIFPSGASIPLVWTDSYLDDGLVWSTTKTYNFGFDIDVLRRKLGLEFDVYYQHTSNLLEGISSSFPTSLGSNTPKYENSGAVENRGFDFTLKHELVVNKDFNYRLRGTFGFARNKVLKKKINDDHPSWRNTIGYPMGARFGLIALGLAQTQEQIDNAPAAPSGTLGLGDILYLDTNGDGKISYKGTESDYVRIGYGALPEISFSMNMDFNYKNFYLNMLWQGVTHVDYQLNGAWGTGHTDGTPFTRSFYNEANCPKYRVEESWTPENPNARYPRLTTLVNGNNDVASTWWLVNGEYLRLKNLTFGYDVPEKILKHTPFTRLNAYIAGTNVLTFSHFKWIDPESPSIAAGFYPQQATWSFGLNVSF